jgi:hypothetical protein
MSERPQPDLGDILQEADAVITVPVRHDGPITIHELPARVAPISDYVLTTAWQMIAGEDLKRRRIILVCDADMLISHAPRGGAWWPAKVPLDLRSASAVYAKVTANTATLTAIPEEWAD